MTQTTRAIELAADRIERAYLLHRPEWRQVGLDRRLWAAAAAVLMDAYRRDPRTPLDPELFVACQVAAAVSKDPWTELTRSSSRRRYIVQVRRLVRGLRRELRREIRRIESRLGRGASLDALSLDPIAGLSPLGLYLIACRDGRADVADSLRATAREQHWACPLYRQAAQGLVAGDPYPVAGIFPEMLHSAGSHQFSIN